MDILAAVAGHVKSMAIVTGVYQPARRVYRALRPQNAREASLLCRQLERFDLGNRLVFDIGANIGAVSEALLVQGARVVAVEPNVSLLSEIEARRPTGGDLVVVGAAVSSMASIVKLHISKHTGLSSLRPDWSETNQARFVPAVTVSELVRTFGRPYYIKVDVEGHELDVVRGMRECVPLLSFEFHMDDRVTEAVEVLRQYATLGAFEANVLLEGAADFAFSDWISSLEFEACLRRLCQSERERRLAYGQVFLRCQ